jgi:DNA invertase Pin-like site-specific DNA recombinase
MPATATARPPARKQAPVAFSYVRFSTRKQAQGDSQRRQTELAAAYCRRHGWKLSEQTFEDLGVSAFHGANALVGNLGEFLKAVQAGTVPPGSALIVESLDRITRQGIDEGYDLIKRILKAGVRLVTLAPERDFDAGATKSLSKGALEIQLILERAAEESERKSERIHASWVGKRRKARENGAIVSGCLPAWVEKRGDKMRLNPERAKAVRRIFELAASGYGRSRIVQTLKAEGIPSFSGKDTWPSCSIGFILTDRRALGMYQPKTARLPDGDPLPDYYPRVVTDQQWLAARAGMAQRRRSLGGRQRPWTPEEDELVRDGRLSVGSVARKLGRTRAAVYQRRHALDLTKKQDRANEGNFVNVFTGLVRNARPPQDSYIVVSRMESTGPSKALLNAGHAEGKAPCYLFQLSPFEKGVLGALRELDPRDVLSPEDEAGPDEVRQLQDALAGVEAELAGAAAFMEANGFSATIGKRVTALEARKAELGAKLLDAQARAACPAAAAWEEYGSLLDALEKAPDQHDARLRLRSALQRVVQRIWLLVIPRGRGRLAAVQLRFHGGGQREYLIQYKTPAYRQSGWWRVASLRSPFGVLDPESPAYIGIAPFDLSDPAGVERTEEMLSLSQEHLEELFGGCPMHPMR